MDIDSRGAWQARAASVLAELLNSAAAVDLPPALWTINDYRPQLSGQVTVIRVAAGESWCDDAASRAAVREWGNYLAAPVRFHRYRVHPSRVQMYVHTSTRDIDISVWAGLYSEDDAR